MRKGIGLFRTWRWLWLVPFVFAAALASAQRTPIQEPKWLDLRFSRIEAGVRFEGDYDKTSFNGGSPITYSRLFLGPELGLDLSGSVFHPNFCRVNFTSDGAYGHSWQSVRSSSGTSDTQEMLYLGNYHFQASFLDPKPYRGSVFVDQNHSFRDNDFYSRVLTDSLSYGADALYEGENWRANGSYAHRDEESTGSGIQSRTISDTANLNLSQTRERGTTALNYSFAQYDYSGAGDQQATTDNNSVTLSDHEQFGSRDQYDLTSRVGYSRTDYSRQALVPVEENEQLTGGLDLNAVHSSTLNSSYTFMADRYQSGSLENSGYSGSGALSHQLYESLASTLTLFGNSSDYEDFLAEGYLRRMGVSWGEGYTKRIGAEHSLRLNNILTLAGTSQKGIASVENESHTFSTAPGNPFPDAFVLNQVNVIRATIRVYDSTKTQLYYEGIAYNVIVNGAQTIIERRPGVGIGGIPAGATVLVDYRAEPTAAGDYTTLGENFRIRLDLWGHLWGIYAGYASSSSSAGDEFGALNYTRLTLGTDLNWKALSAGAEVEHYDSDQSSYNSLGLYQSASVNLDHGASLGVNLSERWIQYLDADREETQYRFNTHYSSQIIDHLRLDAQAGISYRTGNWTDEMLAAFRPTLRYLYGRTTISLDYALEYRITEGSNTSLQNSFRLVLTRRF